MNLRDYAKGKPCMIRIPGVCNQDPATVVLCHIRMAGVTGGGLKAPDFLGAWGCSDCHQAVDSPQLGFRRLFLEGVIRTQYQIIRDGLVKT
jgi:hypothetical protein